jgi:hypothetical protein
MKRVILFTAFALVTIPTSRQIQAKPQATQTDSSITSTRVIGELKAVDSGAKQITLKTDGDSVVAVSLVDSTSFSRLPPGETTLAKASKVTLADLRAGDRVLAMGKVAEDHKTATARTVVIMTKGDIARKQEQERLEWRRRGILGVISAVKPDNQEVIISTRSGMGTQPVIITVSDKLDMRRYAPDSTKFSDAKASVFGEFKVGDQVRALGDRSADGTHFIPEKVVSGSFRTVAGTVTAIDTASGEVKINDLQTRHSLTIVVKADSVIRKFPDMATLMAARGPGAAGPGTNGPGAAGPAKGGPGTPSVGQGPGPPAVTKSQPPPGATGAPAGAGRGPANAPASGPNIQDMLDHLPVISAAELKVGDTIIVSSTKGADPSRLTAITVISGADTLLTLLAPRPQPGAGQTAPNPAGGLGTGINFGIGLP